MDNFEDFRHRLLPPPTAQNRIIELLSVMANIRDDSEELVHGYAREMVKIWAPKAIATIVLLGPPERVVEGLRDRGASEAVVTLFLQEWANEGELRLLNQLRERAMYKGRFDSFERNCQNLVDEMASDDAENYKVLADEMAREDAEAAMRSAIEGLDQHSAETDSASMSMDESSSDEQEAAHPIEDASLPQAIGLMDEEVPTAEQTCTGGEVTTIYSTPSDEPLRTRETRIIEDGFMRGGRLQPVRSSIPPWRSEAQQNVFPAAHPTPPPKPLLNSSGRSR